MEEPIAFFGTYGFCFAAAILIVWSHPNWKGVVLGAFALWFFTFLGMVFLVGRYGTGGPGGAMIMLWFSGGWILSILFCALVRTVRNTVLKRAKLAACTK